MQVIYISYAFYEGGLTLYRGSFSPIIADVGKFNFYHGTYAFTDNNLCKCGALHNNTDTIGLDAGDEIKLQLDKW